MRRPFVISTGALALALLPALMSAQTPPAQTPPTQTPPTQTPPTQTPPATTTPATQNPAQPAAQGEKPPAEPPKVPFTTPAGALLVQIKPDQTAVFEEMVGKLRAGLDKTTDATLKEQASGLRVFKATEPFGENALYLVMIQPAVPSSEYELFAMLQKTMTPEELRAPETAEMWKRYAAAFAAGLSKLSLTPLGSAPPM